MPSASPGPQSVTLGGIASTVAIGTLKANQSILGVGAIAGAAAVGTLKVNQTIATTGIASGTSIGSLTIIADQLVVLSGIASTTAIGSANVSVAGATQTITLSGRASTLAIGSQAVELSVRASGIASTAAVGTLKLNQSIRTGGIASGVAIGSLTVVAPMSIVLVGVAPTSAIGVLTVTRVGDAASLGGGGPDRDEIAAERFSDDKSGWRKPQWVREREQLAAAARVSIKEQPDAEPWRASPVAESRLAPAVSDSGNASVAPGLERASPQLVLEVTAPAQQQAAAVDLDRARIAAKRRQQRELEQIMTVLMMAA